MYIRAKRLISVQQKPDDSSPHLRCSCEAYEWQTLPCCTILRQRSHQSQTGDRPPPSSHNEQQTFTEQSHNCWSYVLIFHKWTKPHQLSTVWMPKVNCCIVNGAKVLYDRMPFLMLIMTSLCCCRLNHVASYPSCCTQSWRSSVINFQGELSGVSEYSHSLSTSTKGDKTEHSKRTTLVIVNYLDWMTVFESVKFKSTREVRRRKLRPNVILRETVIHTQILDPRRETFVQPQVSPPFLEHNPPGDSDGCNARWQ